MKTLKLPSQRAAHAQGFVLMTSLMFILVLAMLGLAAMQGSTLQERMAGNQRDRSIALQAAELALRDAERDLAALKADGVTPCLGGASGCRSALARASDTSLRQGFWTMGPFIRQTWTPDCPDGQCWSQDSTAASAPVWDDTQANWNPQTGSSGKLPTVEYGDYTGATAIPGVAAQPRYILEAFPANAKDVYGTGGTQGLAFRITVRAVGLNPNTVVMLQSVTMPN